MKATPVRRLSITPQSRETWLRLIVIGFTLLFAIAIGLTPGNRVVYLPGLALLGGLGFLLLMRNLQWGIIALVPVSFLVDVSIGTGTNVNLNATFLMTILLLGTWLLKLLVIDKRLHLVPSPANLPALLFIVAGALSWLASFLPWVPLATAKPSLPAQLGAYLIYALSIGAFLLVINTMCSRRWIRLLMWSYIAFGVVYMLAQVIPWSFDYAIAWFVDMHYSQTVYWTLLAALTMGMALFHQGLPKPLRVTLFAAAVLVIAFGLLKRPEWISGWLPPLIAVAILIWLRDWRVGLAVTIVGAIILLPSLQGYIDTRINTESQQWSSLTRLATWPIVFELIKINPLTGLGPASYPFYTLTYSYLGYFLNFNSHNNYFDIALQFGLIGLGLFAWLGAVIFRIGWRLRRMAADDFSRAYANAILAGLAAVLISGTFADWFLPFVYNIGIPGFQSSIYIWLFCGGLVSLYQVNEKP